ncbi:hypothetical protein FPOAC1_007416 [Fusarium poae]|jgi:hypothetical protein|uniref:hypothetical protein n=1 Tax=Fusarium poae TaxID=36050 RepID=UPI001CE7B19E|nr:hypothetical protein FPOAC1_007416 [Fusarium poae]KAG8668054.1 hypothetical protein FPOAC1_007416 [Fusarium poae]
MSSNKDQITHLGSELENLHIPKQTEEHHNNNRTADAISIPDPSGSSGSYAMTNLPQIFITGTDTMSQTEATSGAGSHPASHAAGGRPIATGRLTPISPVKNVNPHPYLSISTALLQHAIMEYLKPDSCYERSVLRRQSVYHHWRWVPYVPTGASIMLGDVELVSIRDDVIRSKIDRQERVFEQQDNVGEFSRIGEHIDLDLTVPEYAGWRVLVWRFIGLNGNRSEWMDRQGRVVANPRAQHRQPVTETKY